MFIHDVSRWVETYQLYEPQPLTLFSAAAVAVRCGASCVIDECEIACMM